MKTRVLVTGFDPFDGEPVNAAWEVVQGLASESDPRADVLVRQLPTVFGQALQTLEEAVRNIQPDIVICVGQAGGRSAVSIERIGVNLDDARIADNAGMQPTERAIIPGGPAAYWSTLPVRKLVEVLREHGIPAEESYTAGTYVCNHVLYGLMHLLHQPAQAERSVIGGFIHIPFLPSQAVRHKNAPSLGADEVRRALQIVIDTLLASH